MPTIAPTKIPQEDTTYAPSKSPTSIPTVSSTTVSTEKVTSIPTESLTSVPTENPTRTPTEKVASGPCYSNNYKVCNHPVTPKSCDVILLPNGAQEGDCLALWDECTGRQGDCCKPGICLGDNSYAQCNPCNEDQTDKFLLSEKGTAKNCKWLQKKGNKKQGKICKKNLSNDVYRSAKEVCKITCRSC